MIELRGLGLFRGTESVVRLTRTNGPPTLAAYGERVAWSACAPTTATLSTSLTLPSGRVVEGVEHFAAAAAGLGLHHGFELEVCEGHELPLLDGSAARWTAALASFGIAPSPARLRITRAATIDIDGSRYELEPADSASVHVELRTSHPLLERHAEWTGDSAQFTREIAPARTFAFAADLEGYLARGARPHVEPEQVVVVGDTLHAAGRPAEPSEPVRHKLLDLLGDLYVHGGPPRGVVRAVAPGHARTHELVKRALQAGVLAAALLVPGSAKAQAKPRFVPSPLSLPTLDHVRPELVLDVRAGFFRGETPSLRPTGAVVRHGYAIELPLLPRRVYVGAKYAFASGQTLASGGIDSPASATSSETVSGNTELSVRSVWVAPAGLALGGELAVTAPTGYYRHDTPAGDVAMAARAMSPNDFLSFWQRSVGFRPALDVRIRAAGFTFQLRQSLSFAVGVAREADSSMVAELGLYVGQQLGFVQIGMEASELYFLDTLFTGAAANRTDATRARFAFMPQVRVVKGPLRPSLGVLYSPKSAYDDTSLLSLHLNVDFAL